MKKFFLPCVGVLGASAVSASAAVTLPESFSTSLTTFKAAALEAVDAIVPVISEVLVGLFVITAIWFIYHAVRRALR